MRLAAHEPKAVRTPARSMPTIWGMTPVELHDRFWLAHGVQVVRQGDAASINPDAQSFLLVDRRSLAIFDLGPLLRQSKRRQPRLTGILLRDSRSAGYREFVVKDAEGRFVRFERVYRSPDARSARIAFTSDRTIAEAWRDAPTTTAGWREIKDLAEKKDRATNVASGGLYNRGNPGEVMRFVRELIQVWKSPGNTIPHLKHPSPGVWVESGDLVHSAARFFGPCWVGVGRQCDSWTTVIGPAVLWDDPAALALEDGRSRRRSDRGEGRGGVRTPTLELSGVLPGYQDNHWQIAGRRNWFSRTLKRGFDVAFSLAALALTLPFYPLVMLCIYLEDGRPFFFGHRRESLGGREFLCWKFRSMRKNAEQIKAMLAQQNMADGPQFFIEDDPRLTVVGRIIRKLQVDEWPQFFNVLLGDMSVVGPRPSPYSENQFCPAWREARLSVRPGITGLWQVKRSRQHGLDFQEWIKYDVDYVENRSLWFDLRIVWDSIWMVVLLATSRATPPAVQATAPKLAVGSIEPKPAAT